MIKNNLTLIPWPKIPVGAMFRVVAPRNKVRVAVDGAVIAPDDVKTHCVRVYDEMNPRTGKMWDNDGLYIKRDEHSAHRIGDKKNTDNVFSVNTLCRIVSQRNGSFGSVVAAKG